MTKFFISYSHKDAHYLERLHTHLTVLKREGKITGWFDRDILAGGDIDFEVSKELNSSDIFLAIVSPDFLASSYCFDREMKAAIHLHNAGNIRIIPVIVEPCDWTSTPLGRFKALPLDGKPIAEWPNKNSAYLDIVKELRRLVDKEPAAEIESARKIGTASSATSGATQYRVKRKFDEIDKNDFGVSAYKIIREYFQRQINDVNNEEDVRARFQDINNQSFTCTVLNNARPGAKGELTIHSKSSFAMGDIYYSYTANAHTNTANGSFNIEATDYDLFLKEGFAMFRPNKDRLTPAEAAQVIWKDLLQRAHIEMV